MFGKVLPFQKNLMYPIFQLWLRAQNETGLITVSISVSIFETLSIRGCRDISKMQLCNCHKRYKNIEPNSTHL